VWQRRWKVLAGFGAVLLLFLAIAAPFAATPRQILGGGVAEHLHLYLAQTSTLWGLSLVLLSPSLILPALVSCLLCGWVAYLWISALRTGRWAERMMYLIAVTTIVNLLVIPYSWSYNHAMLVLPFCYAISQAWRLPERSRLAWIAGLFGLIYPFSRLIYTTLTAVHQSDVFQVIPVLLFLPLMVALQRHVDRSPIPITRVTGIINGSYAVELFGTDLEALPPANTPQFGYLSGDIAQIPQQIGSQEVRMILYNHVTPNQVEVINHDDAN